MLIIRSTLLIGIFLLAPFLSFAQKKMAVPDYYLSSTIPDSLKKDANSVIRFSETKVEVKAPGKAIIRNHLILTILNEKAEEKATAIFYYDKKFLTVNDPEMIVYDADGKLLKRYKKGDMYDRSAISSGSIITDDRMLIASHNIVKYPVTVETRYEYIKNGYLDLSEWHIQPVKTAIQHSVYQISVIANIGFRYKQRNILLKPEKTVSGLMETYIWKVGNLKAIKLEEDSQAWAVLPFISFATDKMEYYGQPGDFSTWKGFGLWQQALNKEVCDLPPGRIEEIKQMVAHLATNKEKAKFLYEYMQKNVRYVSIQLGIGGLRPFPASFVDAKKYGDCKALSNYMYSLLKATGIRSHYAIINAGENEMSAYSDFVNSPFNHVILCVPFEKDSVWLECTSPISAFGKLGNFTENRKALLVKEDGGELVSTPVSRMEDNIFDAKAQVVIDSTGFSKAAVQLKTTGEYRQLFFSNSTKKVDEQKQFLIRYLGLRQPDWFSIKELSDKEGERITELEMEYEKLSDMNTGSRFFYRPGLLEMWKTTFPVVEERKTDVYFSFPLIKNSVVDYFLPKGFELELLPPDVSLKFDYGSFEAKYVYDKDANKLTCSNRFELNRHVVPSAKYKVMQVFMDDVTKALGRKFVVIRKG